MGQNNRPLVCGIRCRILLDKWSEKFSEMDKNFLSEKRLPKRREVAQLKRDSNFFIETQKKMCHMLTKIKKLEVVKLYRQALKDVPKSAKNGGVQDGGKQSSNTSGLLVNRKQK